MANKTKNIQQIRHILQLKAQGSSLNIKTWLVSYRFVL